MIKFLDRETPEIEYLRSKDKRLAKVFEMVGPVSYQPPENRYEFIVSNIIGQMLSNKVAAVLSGRMRVLCNGNISPEVVAGIEHEALKDIGLSNAKVKYIKGFTGAVDSGALKLEALDDLEDDMVIKQLTQIHGIGQWTAKMFLIFALERPDVLPFEDGAFLQSYAWLYRTKKLTKADIEKRCKRWKPYSSYAARYLYRVLDMGFTKEKFTMEK